MKVSVIIAAYNAERYISETLESIVNQDMAAQDYEIIIVNDGSSDGTSGICAKYAAKHGNIVIINRENGGPSAARNSGIGAAKGEYIYFLDADDIAEPDALSQLYGTAKAEDADLVIAKYDIFNQLRTFNVHNIDSLVAKKRIDRYDKGILWTFALWNKLFRKSVIDDNGITFAPVSYSEDGVFVMQFLFASKVITGLDAVVLHYRREIGDDATSITANVSKSKIEDYIAAHRMIYATITENALKDCPHLTRESVDGSEEFALYINEFYRKYVQILINQFHSKYRFIDSESREHIVSEIRDKCKRMSLSSYAYLQNDHPDLYLNDIDASEEYQNENALYTVALFDSGSGGEKLINSLKSLINQDLIQTVIYLPSAVRKTVEESGVPRANIFYLDAESKHGFFRSVYDVCRSEYIAFFSSDFIYAPNALRFAMKKMIADNVGFISQMVLHCDYGEPQTVLQSRTLRNILTLEVKNCEELCFDDFTENKFFSKAFLDSYGMDKMLSSPAACYKAVSTAMFDSVSVIFAGKESEFAAFLNSEKALRLTEKLCEPADESISLNDEALLNLGSRALKKLTPLDENSEPDAAVMAEAIKKAALLPVKNKTLFFSIRADGEITGNAAALYPLIHGEKRIAAKRLPHTPEDEVKMITEVMTSKVIVTDDYLKYLRYFPLREEQRVIQLWHACGAFKKFGLRGTNLSAKTDMATHAQYNLVCVSGNSVRNIYSDAFEVDIDKVQPLGCPETDIFFDAKKTKKIKKQIFSAHKELKKKQIIIYAPTFRDVGGNRSEFNPPIDFARLSQALGKDKIFVICPHPIMENKIVDGNYGNITVVRDFTTKQMMLVSDMLITDYSSVIFEYSLLGRPTAFFCYDTDSYNRNFYLNYPDGLPGPVFRTQEELEKFISDPDAQDYTLQRREFAKGYMSGCDGHSAERIARIINDYLENKNVNTLFKHKKLRADA